MDPHDLRATLEGRAVLLVHENDFLRRYLAEVLADNGATVRVPADDEAWRNDPPPAVLVVSDGVERAGLWVDGAKARGVAVLLLRPSRPGVGRGTADRVMRAPFSGFQVAEAVAALIHDAARQGADGDEA